MNNCHNCRDYFEVGISVYYGKQVRIFCGWKCVKEVATRAEQSESSWPPPIPPSSVQNKK